MGMKHKPGDDTRDLTRRHPLVVLLATERIVLGLTRVEVAEASGIHRNTLETMERGKRGPSLHTFDAWARGMGYRLTLEPIEEEDDMKCPTCGINVAGDLAPHMATAHPVAKSPAPAPAPPDPKGKGR